MIGLDSRFTEALQDVCGLYTVEGCPCDIESIYLGHLEESGGKGPLLGVYR